MPIVTDTPKTPPVEAPVPVKVASPAFRGVTVDTKEQSPALTMTHVAGSSWTVNYYSQVLGADNALSNQSLDRDPTQQQYRLIQNLEIKVTSALNTTQNNEDKAFHTEGNATVYPCGLVPNEGDCFIASLLDGREALFTVTTSNKASVYRGSAYPISYEQVAFSEQDARIFDLNNKVVENLYFNRDYLLHGQNPLITYSEQQLLDELTGVRERIIAYYFKKFFSHEYSTLLLPGQEYSIYDHFLTKHVLMWFRDVKHPNIKFIRQLNMGDDDNFNASNVFTMMHTKSRDELFGAMKKVGLVSRNSFIIDPMMDNIRYSGVDMAVYPADPDKTEDYRRHDQSKILLETGIKKPEVRIQSLFDLIKVDELYGLPNNQAPVINPAGDTYVFSNAFYQNIRNGSGQSALELAVQDYLDGKQFNLTMLFDIAKTYTSWNVLDQFYQLPFLMVLIQSAIRRM